MDTPTWLVLPAVTLQPPSQGAQQPGEDQKFRNIARNGRAAFVVDDLVSVQPWRVRCLEIRGLAEAIDDADAPMIRLRPHRTYAQLRADRR